MRCSCKRCLQCVAARSPSSPPSALTREINFKSMMSCASRWLACPSQHIVWCLQLFGGGGGGAGAGPAAEDFSVSKLAAGVSSWWSALDPTQALQDAAASPGAVASPVWC